MTKPVLTATALISALALAACGPKPTETPPPAPTAAETPPAAQTGKGVGKITALDMAGGKVTLNHEAIPDVGWPAMTMEFKADPTLLKGVKVGDKVNFDVKVENGESSVTAISTP